MIEVYINNSKVNYFDNSLSVKHRINEKSTCSFTVVTPVDAMGYSKGASVTIVDNNNTLFVGSIDVVNRTNEVIYDKSFHTISCIDNHYFVEKRVYAKVHDKETTGQIVKSMIDNVLYEEGITYDYNSIDDGVIASYYFEYEYCDKVLDKLTELSNYSWWVDENKKLYFKSHSFTNSNIVITEDDIKNGTLNIEDDRAMYRNTQIIKGSSDFTDPRSEQFVFVDKDITKTFSLLYKVGIIDSIEVDRFGTGAFLPVNENLIRRKYDSRNLDDALFIWEKDGNAITYNHNANWDLLGYPDADENGNLLIEKKSVVKINYNPKFPVLVYQVNPNEIERIKNIENNGSGKVEVYSKDEKLTSLVDAFNLANKKLDRYGIKDTMSIQFTTLQKVKVGTLITINLETEGINNDYFLVEEVSVKESFPLVWYTVKVVIGYASESWRKVFKRSFETPTETTTELNIDKTEIIPKFYYKTWLLGEKGSPFPIYPDVLRVPDTALYPNASLTDSSYKYVEISWYDEIEGMFKRTRKERAYTVLNDENTMYTAIYFLHADECVGEWGQIDWYGGLNAIPKETNPPTGILLDSVTLSNFNKTSYETIQIQRTESIVPDTIPSVTNVQVSDDGDTNISAGINTNITISWDYTDSVDYFECEYDNQKYITNESETTNRSITFNVTTESSGTITISNIKVIAVYSNNKSLPYNYGDYFVNDVSPIPSSVINLNVTNDGDSNLLDGVDTNITISWDYTGVVDYFEYWYDGQSFTTDATETTNRSVTFNKTTVSGDLTVTDIRVKTHYNGLASQYVYTSDYTVSDATANNEITNINVTNDGDSNLLDGVDTNITISWDYVGTPDYFEYEYDGQSFTTDATETTNRSVTFNKTTLSGDLTITNIKLRVVTSSITSSDFLYSNTNHIVSDYIATVNPVTNLQVSDTGDSNNDFGVSSNIDLTWSHTGNISLYEIYYNGTLQDTTTNKYYSWNATTVSGDLTITNIKVIAVYSGISATETIYGNYGVADAIVVNPVTNLQVSNTGDSNIDVGLDTSINLTWSHTGNISLYEIYYNGTLQDTTTNKYYSWNATTVSGDLTITNIKVIAVYSGISATETVYGNYTVTDVVNISVDPPINFQVYASIPNQAGTVPFSEADYNSGEGVDALLEYYWDCPVNGLVDSWEFSHNGEVISLSYIPELDGNSGATGKYYSTLSGDLTVTDIKIRTKYNGEYSEWNVYGNVTVPDRWIYGQEVIDVYNNGEIHRDIGFSKQSGDVYFLETYIDSVATYGDMNKIFTDELVDLSYFNSIEYDVHFYETRGTLTMGIFYDDYRLSIEGYGEGHLDTSSEIDGVSVLDISEVTGLHYIGVTNEASDIFEQYANVKIRRVSLKKEYKTYVFYGDNLYVRQDDFNEHDRDSGLELSLVRQHNAGEVIIWGVHSTKLKNYNTVDIDVNYIDEVGGSIEFYVEKVGSSTSPLSMQTLTNAPYDGIVTLDVSNITDDNEYYVKIKGICSSDSGINYYDIRKISIKP